MIVLMIPLGLRRDTLWATALYLNMRCEGPSHYPITTPLGEVGSRILLEEPPYP